MLYRPRVHLAHHLPDLEMQIARFDQGQRSAARVVGIAYLLAIPPAIFAQFVVPARLIVYDNAVATAQNIVAHEQLFRLGIAANILDFVIDVALIAALYIALRPVNRPLALFALILRVIETAVLCVTVLADLDALRYLSRARYLEALGIPQLQAMARLSLGGHNAGYSLGLFLAGVGSTVFCYLWLRSGYLPKSWALLGIASSALLAAATFSFIVWPGLSRVVTVAWYGGPIFVFELGVGILLAARRTRHGSASLLPVDARGSLVP